MNINRVTKNAKLLVICVVMLIVTQYLPAGYVYAGIPALVLQQRAALVTIYSGNADGGQATTEKGFLVDKNGIIAVPYRAISGKSTAPGSGQFVRTAEGSYVQIEQVVAVDKENGVALLKVDFPGPAAVKLSPDPGSVSGENVFIPVSLSNLGDSVIEGKTVMLSDGTAVVVFTQAVPPGIGGSPISDSRGHVIGMVDSKTENGKIVNHLISSEHIAALLEEYEKTMPQLNDSAGSQEQAVPSPDELDNELEKAKTRVEQDPDNARGYVLLGWAYSRSGMYADAIDAYQDAAKLKPGSAGIYNNIGVIYGRNMGMYDKAIMEFREALKLKPDYDEARFNLAVAYVFSDDMDSALKEYRKLKQTDQERALKLFNLIYDQQKE